MKNKTYFCKTKQLTEHKSIETQLQTWSNWNYFELEFKWTRKSDHAGAHLCIHLFGIELNLTVYDHRHWNYKHNRWMSIQESIQEATPGHWLYHDELNQ